MTEIDYPALRRFATYRKDDADWLGANFAVDWPYETSPGLHEELFEWISLLEAVFRAQERFVMLELGAGFGRWGIWAAMAARSVGIDNIRVRLVEAEPQHALWAAESICLNGVDLDVSVIEAAVSNHPDRVPFKIDLPALNLDAPSWWGQSVQWGPSRTPTDEVYFGHPVFRDEHFGLIWVPPITLERAIEGLDRIDLIDADLQGAETELLEWMDLLTSRVRVVHIGTHGTEIEAALRAAFGSHGWIAQWDFACGGERETPFGRITFEDGVQTWVNPELVNDLRAKPEGG